MYCSHRGFITNTAVMHITISVDPKAAAVLYTINPNSVPPGGQSIAPSFEFGCTRQTQHIQLRPRASPSRGRRVHGARGLKRIFTVSERKWTQDVVLSVAVLATSLPSAQPRSSPSSSLIPDFGYQELLEPRGHLFCVLVRADTRHAICFTVKFL